MNIVICDDESASCASLKADVEEWAAQRHVQNAVLVRCFSSSEDLLETWQKGYPIDLLFLDIEIPGELNGLELAKKIRDQNEQVSIVFVTNYFEYACEGYYVNALRFLPKPVAKEQILECLDIAYRQWTIAEERFLFLPQKKQKLVVPIRKIIFIEAQAHYTTIHFIGGKPIRARSRLKELAAQLPAASFAQCHRSYIVNVQYVRSLEKGALFLAGGETIPVGESYTEYFLAQFKQYYQGESL